MLPAAGTPPIDDASREWLRALQDNSATRDEPVARLHALLLRAARCEAVRRRGRLSHLRDELEEIAHEAAGDALISVLARLDNFRGESRFTTWVYKFALLETAAKLRKRVGRGASSRSSRKPGTCFASVGLAPDEHVEQSELLLTLQTAIGEVLTPHQGAYSSL